MLRCERTNYIHKWTEIDINKFRFAVNSNRYGLTCREKPGEGEDNPPERARHAEEVDQDKHQAAQQLPAIFDER